ncbi:hypothetical protein [Labedella gwakjiensis]|uniref:Protein kinase domain-containing protein n=1 Tax=Labedella gwakjiensis TaxID=390269 RepID=A0ABY0C7Z6_9MICO|nr:hypothetical protein [Labedella gwakjiensis]RUQ86178.1 hypothetical protein ELQ93_03990 [Labedella gwakjiensis]
MTRDAALSPTDDADLMPQRTAASPASDPLLAGYRLLRRVPDRHGGRVYHAAADGASGLRTSATIVVFDGDRGSELAMRLVERLELLGGDSIPRVLDVCVDRDGHPAVVLDFCGDLLSSILASGARLSGGEVVTLLAPVFAAVLAVHDRGFVHGGISSSCIAIGRNGRPVLLGCDRAEDLRGPGDRRERERRTADDARAFADLVEDLGAAVADVSESRRVRAAAAKIRDGASSPFSTSFRSEAEVRLFEIAEPAPLMFVREAEGADGAATEQVTRSLVPAERRRQRRRGGASVRFGRRPSVDGVRQVLAHASSRMSSLVGPLSASVRSGGRRRRVLLSAIAGICAAAVVVLLIPAGEPVAGQLEPGDVRTSPPSLAGATRGSSPGEDPDASPPEATADADADGGHSDDAIAGTRAVLDVVARCARDQTDVCWSAAVEPGSRLSAAVSHGGAAELPSALLLPVEAVEIVQEDDFGDARLIVITPTGETKPASVLMIRTEAGWRLREVFET